ncbi:MAG: ATP synthase F1 subunit gamma [Planctomycetes bacterium]|nr:ATP synthase F1 subunit gamma [Planctomycetota bacterium]
MANLRDIRKRRKSAANTRKITRTMELVASAKLKKAQDAAAASRPYAEGLRDLVSQLAPAGGKSSHPLMTARPAKKVMILVGTSDRGLAGAFNANLVNKAIARAKEHRAAGREVQFVALGKKGASTLSYFGFTPTATHQGLVGATKYPDAEKVANGVIEQFTSGQVDLVEVVYARFVSSARQIPDSYVMLPASGEESAEKKKRSFDYIYIPEPEDVLAAIIPLTIKTAFFSAMLQTSAAEHAARRVAMKNATDAAADMVKALSGAYNRSRQGKITQEIAEIVGAVEAMA